ncbi:MAG: hypothetical protein AAF235_05440, partial [Planctomycetota bacterium]
NALDGVWQDAVGLPQVGDQYADDNDGTLEDCFAATIEPIGWGNGNGVLAPGDTGYDAENNGWVRVRVQYRSPSGGNGNIGLTTSYTQFAAGVSAERIFVPRDASGLPDTSAGRQLAGGQGAVVQNGEITATLYRYFPGGVPGAFTNLLIALSKPCHVNQAGVVFPRVGGQQSTQSLAVGPGQSLFRGFGETRLVSGNVYEVPLYFGLAADWLFYEAEADDDGSATGTLLSEVVHPSGNFALVIDG